MNVMDNITAPVHVPETPSLQGALDDFQFPVPTSRSVEVHAALMHGKSLVPVNNHP